MATTTDPNLPGNTGANVNGTPVDQYMGSLVNNPTLPPGAEQVPTLLKNTPDQELNTQGLQGDVTGQLTQAGPSQAVQQPSNIGTSTYDATLTGYENAAQGTAAHGNANDVGNGQAAQGTVDPNALIQNQFQQLAKTDVNHDGVPDFAADALRKSNEDMAARGLGSSSIAQAANTSAIFSALFPMAQFNATNYQRMSELNLTNEQQMAMQNSQQKFTMTMQNLTNDQQMALQNVQNRQQVLLSDQAADNAAKQFNSASENQTNQFMANLSTQVALNNASRADALSQFNAGQSNSMEQFNAQLKDLRERFNVQNQLAIDQSNVQWRRDINTANTAAINAANQTNAQNLFNLSNQALANVWQQFRDEASWANTAAENDKTRAHNLAVAALQRDAYFQGLDAQGQSDLFSNIGKFATNLLGTLVQG